MKQNFRYITKFEEETRAERLEKRMVNTLAVYLPTNQAYFFFMGDEKKSPSTWTRIFVNQSTKDVLSTKQDLEEWAKSEGKDLTKIRKGLYVVDPDYNANSSSAQLERRGQSGDRLNTESIRKEVVNSYFENVGIHYEKDEVNVIDDTHATSKVEQTIGGWQSGWNGKSFTVPVGLPCIPATNLPRKGWWLDNTAPKVKAFIKKIIAMWADAPVENNSSSARLEKRMASKPQPRSDKESEREIMLEITNNYNKESGRLKSIIENLARKMNKQNYDKALASKLYAYLVEDGIKSYTKEFGKGSISLSPASRLAMGAELEEYYVDDVDAKANELAGIDPQQDLIDAESKRLDWKQNSSSARLEKRGWFGGDDEDEEEEKQPMSNNDAREEVRLYIMNTQGIYSAWMSMVDDACKQWLRTHDKEDDAPTFRDVVDDFTEIVRLGINEMNKVIHDDSENSEFPENNFSMADIKWIFEHSSAQEDLDEKWDWRKE